MAARWGHLMGRVVSGLLLMSLPVIAAASVSTPQGQGGSGAPAILRLDRVIRYELFLSVAPERVYAAWTNADQLVEWFPHWAEMTVAEGEGYRMGWEGYDGVWEGTYLEVDDDVLAFTWLPPPSVFPAASYPTTVRLTFEEVDEGTKLVLQHSGFLDTPELEAHVRSWQPYLYALRAFLLRSPEAGT